MEWKGKLRRENWSWGCLYTLSRCFPKEGFKKNRKQEGKSFSDFGSHPWFISQLWLSVHSSLLCIIFITSFYNPLHLSVPLPRKLLEGADCIFVFMVPAKSLARSRCSRKLLTLTGMFFSRIGPLTLVTTISGSTCNVLQLFWVLSAGV